MADSFLKIFAELEAAVRDGVLVQYAVGGAIAAARYVEAVETEDVDVFAIARPGSGSALMPFADAYEWFKQRGARWQDEHLVVGGWPLHLLPSTGPLLDDALANVEHVELDAQSVRLFSFEHLAAIALETNRPKDRLRLQMMWSDAGFDRNRFLDLVERFGLTERWKKLRPLLEE